MAQEKHKKKPRRDPVDHAVDGVIVSHHWLERVHPPAVVAWVGGMPGGAYLDAENGTGSFLKSLSNETGTFPVSITYHPEMW